MKTLICYNNDNLILIDDCEYERLNKHNWRFNGHGAIQTSIKINNKWFWINITCYVMREKALFDHIDRNIWNNQKSNLRKASFSQNCVNRIKKLKYKSSKFRGVCFHSRDKVWAAKITVNKRQISLGYFNTELKAALAYDRAAIEYHGEFAITNKSLGLL